MKRLFTQVSALILAACGATLAAAQPSEDARGKPPEWVLEQVPPHAAERIAQGGTGRPADDTGSEEVDTEELDEGEEQSENFANKRLACHLNGTDFDNDRYLGVVISMNQNALTAHCGHPIASDHYPSGVIESAMEECQAAADPEELVETNSRCVHEAAVGKACSRAIDFEGAVAALCNPSAEEEPASDPEVES